ncbi:hypothetical protein CANCADRAFT_32146 [Tortispora caseinolytica NRRL Y-17796]|uniref:Copper transport protein n=1 Tax=Tortispora caseinolytica NRRL Y-17796 TaxID=767744 RepID=A0A1E4TA04_9ASCO|nr:hypothetical protein CANCADRAFT_32146 [Tortispora caseinolytica NRRL Y-17796]
MEAHEGHDHMVTSMMEMASSTIAAAMDMTSTRTAATAAATTSKAMSMSMGSSTCKISMLWNWNTIDACFIHRGWHITSRGMFAGSCIGIFLMAFTTMGVNRALREFDRYIVRSRLAEAGIGAGGRSGSMNDKDISVEESADPGATAPVAGGMDTTTPTAYISGIMAGEINGKVYPALWQQLLKAFLYGVYVCGSYFCMLLAMYYNGYVIICLFLGFMFGHFAFTYEPVAERSAVDKNEGCCC